MGGKVVNIVIIALLVVLIGLIGFVAVYGLQAINNSREPVEIVVKPERTLSQREIDLVKFTDPLISNLKIGETGTKHAVSLRISIGVDNTDAESAELISLLHDREPVIRDVIGQILKVTTYEDLTELNEFNGIEILRANIISALRAEFATSLIVNVVMDVIYQ